MRRARPTLSVEALSLVPRKSRSHSSNASQRSSSGVRFHRSHFRHTTQSRPLWGSNASRRPTGNDSIISLLPSGRLQKMQVEYIRATSRVPGRTAHDGLSAAWSPVGQVPKCLRPYWRQCVPRAVSYLSGPSRAPSAGRAQETAATKTYKRLLTMAHHPVVVPWIPVYAGAIRQGLCCTRHAAVEVVAGVDPAPRTWEEYSVWGRATRRGPARPLRRDLCRAAEHPTHRVGDRTSSSPQLGWPPTDPVPMYQY